MYSKIQIQKHPIRLTVTVHTAHAQQQTSLSSFFTNPNQTFSLPLSNPGNPTYFSIKQPPKFNLFRL